jgi:hypothetical protein
MLLKLCSDPAWECCSKLLCLWPQANSPLTKESLHLGGYNIPTLVWQWLTETGIQKLHPLTFQHNSEGATSTPKPQGWGQRKISIEGTLAWILPLPHSGSPTLSKFALRSLFQLWLCLSAYGLPPSSIYTVNFRKQKLDLLFYFFCLVFGMKLLQWHGIYILYNKNLYLI